MGAPEDVAGLFEEFSRIGSVELGEGTHRHHNHASLDLLWSVVIALIGAWQHAGSKRRSRRGRE